MTTRRAALLVALAAATAACATARPAPRASLLSDSPPAYDRSCSVADAPAELPEPEALVDAAALRADAARLWNAAGRPAGHVLFSLRYDPQGVNIRRAVIEHSVSGALADSLQALVFAHRRETTPAPGEWGVRLRVDLGETPALRVGRREVCRPAPRDVRPRLANVGFDVRDGYASMFTQPSMSDMSLVWVRVRLDERGFVTDARIERSLVRGQSTEMRLLNYVRTLTFHPAREDGYPVPGEASFPIRIPN